MTRVEFAQVMAYLEAGCSKPLSAASAEVYFDALGDLPLAALQVAAKRVLFEHRWATFPSIAELAQAASETMRGIVSELSAAEAWHLAWRAARKIDLEQEGSADRHMRGLPALVGEAMLAFSLAALVGGKEPVAVVRAQFTKIFEQLAARERRVALLPAPLRERVEEIGKEKALPAPAKGDILRIGKLPEQVA